MAAIGFIMLFTGVLLFASVTVTFKRAGKAKAQAAFDDEADADTEMDVMLKLVSGIIRGAAAVLALAGAILFIIGRFFV